MKKYLLTSILALIAISGGLALPHISRAACVDGRNTETGAVCLQVDNNRGNLSYTPLEPIPGFTGSNSDLIKPGGLATVINLIFKILITAGALAAVLSLTIGGIQYMISEAVPNKKAGLTRARASVFAIVLIASIWLILNTINPQLLNFNLNPCPQGAAGCTIQQTQSTNSQNTQTTGGSCTATLSAQNCDSAGGQYGRSMWGGSSYCQCPR